MSWSRCGIWASAPGWTAVAWVRLSWNVSHQGDSTSSTIPRTSSCWTSKVRAARTGEDTAEPLGALAIEAPLAERRRFEVGGEIGVERGDLVRRQEVRDDAIAVGEQPLAPMADRSFKSCLDKS